MLELLLVNKFIQEANLLTLWRREPEICDTHTSTGIAHALKLLYRHTHAYVRE